MFKNIWNKSRERTRGTGFAISFLVAIGLCSGIVLNIKAMSEIHGGTKWLIFIAVFVPALIFALYQVRVKREAYSAEQDAIEASRLWNIRMLSGKPSPVIMFKSVSKRWVINDDYSTDYRETLEIEAVKGDIDAYAMRFFADENAKPIPFLKKHGLKVRVGNSLVNPVVFDDTDWKKSVAVLFPHPIKEGQSETVTYDINWPGYWNSLQGGKPDEATWYTVHDCEDATLTVVFPSKVKRREDVSIDAYPRQKGFIGHLIICLLYTSDAADDLLCVDLGGRRIIKKKK